MQPYKGYVAKFNLAFIALQQIAPTINSVNDLPSEEEDLLIAEFLVGRIKRLETTTECYFYLS